jgi:hypothetical protein
LDAPARQVPTAPERAETGGAPPDAPGSGNLAPPELSDGFPFVKLPSEYLEWARQQVNEEEIIAAMREIHETGGLELRDFLHELEEATLTVS